LSELKKPAILAGFFCLYVTIQFNIAFGDPAGGQAFEKFDKQVLMSMPSQFLTALQGRETWRRQPGTSGSSPPPSELFRRKPTRAQLTLWFHLIMKNHEEQEVPFGLHEGAWITFSVVHGRSPSANVTDL